MVSDCFGVLVGARSCHAVWRVPRDCGAVGKRIRVLGTRSKLWGFCLAGWGALSSACSDDDLVDPLPPNAERVPSRPGIVQVSGDDGPLLGEGEACERFRAAWETNQLRLACGESNGLLECPALVQPLASMKCVSYTLESVNVCTAKFDAAERCEELVAGACVLTAVVEVTSPDCVSDAAAGIPGDAALDVGADSSGETSLTSAGATGDSGALSETGATTSSAPTGEAGLSSGEVATGTPDANVGEAGTPHVELDASVGQAVTTQVELEPDAN